MASIATIAMVTLGCRSERAAPSGVDAATAPRAAAPIRADSGAFSAAHVAARGALTRARVPGISFAVVTRERDVDIGGVGLADEPRRIDATGETVFQAASIAKVIVATCVMQMVEEGRLGLDEDVSKYLGFAVKNRAHSSPITLRLLLTHRSSIRDVAGDIEAPAEGNPLGTFLEKYVARRAAFSDRPPGAATAYSNVGVSLAALAVERVARESFAVVSARRVFTPLGMTSTTWARSSAPDPPGPSDASTGSLSLVVARPHVYEDGGFVARPNTSHALYPVVDLRSSARDLARFGRAILGSGALDGVRILSSTSVDEMLRAQTTDGGDADQGLAWQLRTLGGARVAGHEGEDVGTTTALFLDVPAGTGMVVLANGDAFGAGEAARGVAIENLVVDLLAVARAR